MGTSTGARSFCPGPGKQQTAAASPDSCQFCRRRFFFCIFSATVIAVHFVNLSRTQFKNQIEGDRQHTVIEFSFYFLSYFDFSPSPLFFPWLGKLNQRNCLFKSPATFTFASARCFFQVIFLSASRLFFRGFFVGACLSARFAAAFDNLLIKFV